VCASFNVTEIRSVLADHAAEVVTALLGRPNHRLSSKQELRFGSRGSLAVAIAGTKAGSWYDHENGVGGDLFTLVRKTVGGGLVEALEYVESIIGYGHTRLISQAPAHHREPEEDWRRNRWRALALWQEAVPIVETIVIRYMAKRRILDQALATDTTVLRFHPVCPFGAVRYPCLLALMRDVRTNEPSAIQRTALSKAGEKIDRMTLGPKSRAAIKLTADEDVTMGLTVGEGLETVLSATQWGFSPAWALADASNVRAFPVLSGVECLTILVDNDESGTGQRAALECSSRWTSAGREVFRIIPDRCGDDLNDIVVRTMP
jgi:putative DNA primase/helicase